MKKNIFTAVLLCILSINLFAEGNLSKLFGNSEVFKLDPVTDGLLLGTGLTLSGTAILFDKVIKIKDTSFDGNLFDKNDVNPFDRVFMNPYSDSLHLVATGLVVVELLSPAILAATSTNEWFTIGTMYAEAFLLSYGIKDTVKALVNRPRPYMYSEGYPQKKVDDGDWCKSWPSGHTTNAFLGAGFTSYVFCKYFPDSPWRFAVIGGTYALAAATGILRIASGNHFLTDVLTGAIIGTACGILVPAIHYANGRSAGKSSKSSIQASPLGVSFSVKL